MADHAGDVTVVANRVPEAALDVRRAVFVEGQGVAEERELDGKDGTATHFLAREGDDVVGTARLRELGESDRDAFVEPDAVLGAGTPVGKVERVAVRESRRGEGWGRRLMEAVEREARRRGLPTLVLHGQTRVAGFYERLGYGTVSDTFAEAGMPHVEMVRAVDAHRGRAGTEPPD